jgi:phosphoesterase RecJ-like protein
MINNAAKILKEKSNFLITTHISPDGDAVGSISALAGAIKKLGKNVRIYLEDKVPQEFLFLPESDSFSHVLPDEHFDVVFVADCADLKRIGNTFNDFKNYDMLINIDHHKANDNFGDINIVDKNACSTGVLVYKILNAACIEIDYDIALAIYTTILLDTGSFRYSNTSAEAFKIAVEMIDKGVNAWDVAERVYENQPLNRISLLKLSLEQMETYIDKGFASITISKKMLEETDANFDITNGFINFPRSIQGIEVALLFKELDYNKYKLSLRSKGDADVAMIAENFGGGGHKNAAGCLLNGSIDDVKEKVFSYVRDYLKEIN